MGLFNVKIYKIMDLVVVPKFFPLNSPTHADLIAMMGLFPVAHRVEISCDTALKLFPQKIASMLYPNMS